MMLGIVLVLAIGLLLLGATVIFVVRVVQDLRRGAWASAVAFAVAVLISIFLAILSAGLVAVTLLRQSSPS